MRPFFLLYLAWLMAPAEAHLLPAQTATMNLVGNVAYFVVAVPMSALEDVDADGNGRLSISELNHSRLRIAAQFEARFHATDDTGPAQSVLTWILPPDDTMTESTYVIVLHRVDFASPPVQPVLSTDLFGKKADEATMTLTATRGEEREVSILRPGAPTHRFFRGPLHVFLDFIAAGLRHILGGTDHLLFLLTLITGATGWRYWMGITTAFTLAHSLTLALSVLGLLRLPATYVEPAIAASIVVTALINLGSTGLRIGVPIRLLLAFACGLLHGFGFASALALPDIDPAHRLATLGGFNLGIEIGQCLFLAAVLTAFGLLRKSFGPRLASAFPVAAGWIALVGGSLMLLGRLSPGLAVLP